MCKNIKYTILNTTEILNSYNATMMSMANPLLTKNSDDDNMVQL